MLRFDPKDPDFLGSHLYHCQHPLFQEGKLRLSKKPEVVWIMAEPI